MAAALAAAAKVGEGLMRWTRSASFMAFSFHSDPLSALSFSYLADR
jgi:hypothetical protein